MGSEEGHPVCVMGAGRSGTSLLARAVILLGIYFGREEAMAQPNELNPRGFWELLEVGALNEQVLESTPSRRQAGWETAAELESFRARIETIIERHFAGQGRWGFKHWSNTLVSPLWQAVVGKLDYVICLRNPLEIRASVEAGRNLLPDAGKKPANWRLWASYYCEALRNTAGQRRAFVFYGDWFVDPLRVVDELTTFLYGDADQVAAKVRAQVAATVEGSLYRQRASELDLAVAEQVPSEVRALYFLMRDLAVAESRGEERAQALQAVAVAMDHPSED